MMWISRTAGRVLSGSLLALALSAAFAQTGYPTRPVRIIVPTSPPGGADVVARTIAPPLSERVHALGVTSAKRVPATPDIPTIAEAGVPGYESLQWYGLLAPTGTPKEIIARLNKETVAILRTPEIATRLANDGAEVVAGTPEEFGAYIRAETEKWARVVKAAGIKPE